MPRCQGLSSGGLNSRWTIVGGRETEGDKLTVEMYGMDEMSLRVRGWITRAMDDGYHSNKETKKRLDQYCTE
jgi:hypothetical protein